ncbi:MAG TPA: EMC3/TMCO1 family protein [Methanoregulaceae archaeon]|nr:EMC3/TMCO1 family protein [Methanoregulaceae archaeon]HPD74884.1 EMC3/TMCO1 family protein [Methanoregulaceae archaeon]
MKMGEIWEKYGLFIALGFMMLMMLSYSIEPLRVGVGQAIDTVFAPLVIGFNIPFYILIVILSAFTGLYSSIIQKYTIDYEKMSEAQERMKEFQKEFREAQLSQDEKKIKKMEAKQQKVMREQMEMSQQQFKPMAYILVLTVPIFFWLLYRLSQIHSTITLPFAGLHSLNDPVLWVIPAWILWYMICSLALSQVIRKALNIGGI